jgi:hypothetical protein
MSIEKLRMGWNDTTRVRSRCRPGRGEARQATSVRDVVPSWSDEQACVTGKVFPLPF